MRRSPLFAFSLVLCILPLNAGLVQAVDRNLDLKGASPQVEALQKSPDGQPALKPSRPEPIDRSETVRPAPRSIRGSLQQRGRRLIFRLKRPVRKLEVYAGKRRLGQLGGGVHFDLTPFLRETRRDRLLLHYEGRQGARYSQEVSIRKYRLPEGSRAGSLKADLPEPAPSPGPDGLGSISFLSPKAGDYLFQGMSFQIRLQGQGHIPEPCYSLTLYQGNTQVRPIALQKCGPNHIWTVPSDLSGSGYRIRLRTLDGAVTAESGKFPILSSAPDLQVQNVRVVPGSPSTDDTIELKATVSNAGRLQADAVTGRLVIERPNGQQTTFPLNIPRLPFGGHHFVRKRLRIPRSGQYTASVHTEVTLAQASEANVDNNSGSVSFQVAGLPDLVVCLHQTRNVQLDHWEYIWVNVKNIGQAPSSSTDLHIWIDNRGTEVVSVPGLMPGSENLGFRYEMWVSRYPSRDYWAHVDMHNVVREGRDDNNRQSGVIVKHLRDHADEDYRCSGD